MKNLLDKATTALPYLSMLPTGIDLLASLINQPTGKDIAKRNAVSDIKRPLDYGYTGVPYFNYGGLVPIQAEKDEQIINPDGSIDESNATTTHENMNANQVTDVLTAGSKVLSNKKFSKKTWEAANELLGGNILNTDYLNLVKHKTKISPADIVDSINKKWGDKKTTKNAFNTEKLNKENAKIMANDVFSTYNKLLNPTNQAANQATEEIPKAAYGLDTYWLKAINKELIEKLRGRAFNDILPTLPEVVVVNDDIPNDIQWWLNTNTPVIDLPKDQTINTEQATKTQSDVINNTELEKLKKKFNKLDNRLFAANESMNLLSTLAARKQKMYPMQQLQYVPMNTDVPVGNLYSNIFNAEKVGVDALRDRIGSSAYANALISGITANTQDQLNSVGTNIANTRSELERAKKAQYQQFLDKQSAVRAQWDYDNTALNNYKKKLLPEYGVKAMENTRNFAKNKYDLAYTEYMNIAQLEALKKLMGSKGITNLLNLFN